MRLAITVFILSCLPTPIASGATVSGTVVDVLGNPISGARVDHIGRLVVVPPPDAAIEQPNEPRTDAEGHFQITTISPALVIRKPGYQSERVRVTGDAQMQVTLQPVKPFKCKVEPLPKVKTKKANDVDYTASWFYVETKNGPKGIISGQGSSYSFGAPGDRNVWASLDYFEVMLPNGVIDARGHSADGKYWRMQTRFGAAAQYYDVDQSTAEVLDCIMDRVLVR
jgi:hypothetical protein